MILFLIFFPLLSACCCIGVSRRSEQAALYVMFTASAVTFAAALFAALFEDAAVPAFLRAASSASSDNAAALRVLIPVAMDQGLLLEYDGFRRVCTVLFSFMWMMSAALTPEYFRGHRHLGRYAFFTLLTLGALMGVFLSGNFFTALVFFEIMSFASFPWVIQEEDPDAVRAAYTYLAIAVIGGLAALMGIFLLQHELGTTEFSQLHGALEQAAHPGRIYVAGCCILAGFGAKAGMFPLHIWLPKAHPVAPAPASALLSGALTKSGIFGILGITCTVFLKDVPWGVLMLSLGAVTMLLGAVLAVFSVNLKRTLACSSMSQIGFILTGTGVLCLLGEEGSLASSGILLHMVNHALFKLVLFLSAGAVFMNAHTLDLNALKGIGKGRPSLLVPFLFGALGISGIPGFSGYISKTLLHESIVEAAEHYGILLNAVEWIFLFSGGLTLAYMTKLFVCLFIESPDPHKDPYPFTMRPLTVSALWISALLIPVLGSLPALTMEKIASFGTDFMHVPGLQESVSWFSPGNLLGAAVSVAVAVPVYFFFIRGFLMKDGKYLNRWPSRLDLEDAFYRPLLLTWLPEFFGALMKPFAENTVTGAVFRCAVSAAGTLSETLSSLADSLFSGRIFRSGTRLLSVFARFFSDLPDAIVLLLSKTVFKPLKKREHTRVNHSVSYSIGSVLDTIDPKAGKDEHPHAKKLYTIVHTLIKTTHELIDSVSFALFLLAAAVCAVLIYVLVLRG